MPVTASLVGGAVGLAGGIAKLFGSANANSQLNNLIKQDPTYTANPLAAQRVGLAQSLLNARAPGAAYAERNIYGNQANQQANIERNATDGSQALAMGAANQASTNQAFGNLSSQEDQEYQQRLNNLTGAQQGEINEGDKVYQDQVRRFGDLAQIRGQQNANTQNAWQSVSNLGFGAMNFGLQGGFNKLFPAGGGTPSSSGMGTVQASPSAMSYMSMAPVQQGGSFQSPYYINPNI